jgi:CDP-glucose 4,6-dehydratase
VYLIDLSQKRGYNLKVLVTGNSGFKGSWLTVLLSKLGHTVVGLSNEDLSSDPSDLGSVGKSALLRHHNCDIRYFSDVKSILDAEAPDAIIHLAAESLVQRSQKFPIDALETNAVGTANILMAASQMQNDPILICATTDKVYAPSLGSQTWHVETSLLEGTETYSRSKVVADILTQAYITSVPKNKWAIVRAGNVIGGGDRSVSRLIPDAWRSYQNGQPLLVRNPNSTRPWQHVLDCLLGYVVLMEKLNEDDGRGAWNFGPNKNQLATVGEVTNILSQGLKGLQVTFGEGSQDFYESDYLSLDSTKAQTGLGWHPKYELGESLQLTLDWYIQVSQGTPAIIATSDQVDSFLSRK